MRAAILVDPVRIHHRSWLAARAAVGLAGRSLLAGWRHQLLSSAQDVTEPSAGRSCLVVATHPGDETLSTGATIARKRAAGTPVHVLVVTDGRHGSPSRYVRPRDLAAQRAEELARAGAMLGVDADHLEILGFEEGTLGRCGDELTRALARRLAELGPDEILLPWARELAEDRRATHDAAVRALVGTASAAHVAAYPVDLWVHGPFARTPGDRLGGVEGLRADLRRLRPPRSAELIRSGDYVYLKQAALDCYASLVTNLTGEVEWRSITTEAARRISSVAEVFFPLTESDRRAVDGAAAGGGTADGVRTPTDLRPVPAPAPPVSEIVDTFADDQSRGAVVGTISADGARRGGVDVEGTIAVHDGRLRLDPLAVPGWGRQGVAYGPFSRRPGLAVAARILHSHGNAHTDHGGIRRTWLMGQLLRQPFFGQLLPVTVEDNLTVGFQGDEAPADARLNGSSFVVRAAGAVNGELRARVADGTALLHRGLQDVPYTYVVVLRPEGAVYYASALPGAGGACPHPWMRPLAIDPAGEESTVYAAVHQAVHGEGDYRMSTGVEEVRVADVASLGQWCTSALAADRLTGATSPLAGSAAERGGPWRALEGSPVRSAAGVVADLAGSADSGAGAPADAAGAQGNAGDAANPADAEADPGDAAAAGGGAAVVDLGAPAGLVHVRVSTGPIVGGDDRAGLLWRVDPAAGTGWRVLVGNDRAELSVAADGRWSTVAEGPARLPSAHRASLQVLDDGQAMTIHLDGQLLFDGPLRDGRHADATGAGVVAGPAALTLSDFEAHPRQVPVPAELDLGEPWQPQGCQIVVCDDFDGPAGELASAAASSSAEGRRRGAPAWERSLGGGRFDLTGARSLRVRADRDAPNPDRTAYTVAWDGPHFADLQVDLLPPGVARSQGHGSRGGLVFWQDEDNYLVLNLWIDDSPTHDGSALSFFYRCQRYERMTDAAWSNVGRKVTWGRRSQLRASCDGRRVLAWIDGEPVLQRHLRDVYPGSPRLAIRRVGLVANQEWGDDTGTTFYDFVARSGR